MATIYEDKASVSNSLNPLTLTTVAPVEVRVSILAAGELRSTMPKSATLVLALGSDITAPDCAARVSEAPYSPALNVAVCELLTAATSAMKLALVAAPVTPQPKLHAPTLNWPNPARDAG